MRFADGNIYISVKQAAARVPVTPDTIHYHITAGHLRYIYIDRRYWIEVQSLITLYAN